MTKRSVEQGPAVTKEDIPTYGKESYSPSTKAKDHEGIQTYDTNLQDPQSKKSAARDPEAPIYDSQGNVVPSSTNTKAIRNKAKSDSNDMHELAEKQQRSHELSGKGSEELKDKKEKKWEKAKQDASYQKGKVEEKVADLSDKAPDKAGDLKGSSGINAEYGGIGHIHSSLNITHFWSVDTNNTMLRFTNRARGVLFVRNFSHQQQLRCFSINTPLQKLLTTSMLQHTKAGLLIPLQKFSTSTNTNNSSVESTETTKDKERAQYNRDRLNRKPRGFYIVTALLIALYIGKIVISTKWFRESAFNESKNPETLESACVAFLHNLYAFSPETIIKEGILKLAMKAQNDSSNRFHASALLLKLLLEFDSVHLLLLKDGVPNFVKMIMSSPAGLSIFCQIISNKKNHQALLESEAFLKQLIVMAEPKETTLASYFAMERFFSHRHLVDVVRKQPLVGEILNRLNKNFSKLPNMGNMIGIYNGDLDPWTTPVTISARVDSVYGAQTYAVNAMAGATAGILTYLYCSWRWKKLSKDAISINIRSSFAALSSFFIVMLTPSLYIRSEAAHKQINKNISEWAVRTYDIPKNLLTHYHSHNPTHSHPHNPTHNAEDKGKSGEVGKTNWRSELHRYLFCPEAITIKYLTCNGLMTAIFLSNYKYSRFVVLPQFLCLAAVLAVRFSLYREKVVVQLI
eukprot:TRINITY_DN5407_c0_g1_i6.p1 TRINITY_DN5407_c0_g1~~TRINITY_DN5407_c0_g1_i6.p1  ORF type:complete len:686 (-),score=105.64 TRINITY_DN5407_c0_g1_i6:49-2106(-)